MADKQLIARLKKELKEAEQTLASAVVERNGFRNELRKAEDKWNQAQVKVDAVKSMLISALEN